MAALLLNFRTLAITSVFHLNRQNSEKPTISIKKIPPRRLRWQKGKNMNAQAKASAKYDKANTKMKSFKFNLNTDADILARLEALQNAQGFIKGMIRNNIKDLGLDCTPEQMAYRCGMKGNAVKLEVVDQSMASEARYTLTFENGEEAHITITAVPGVGSVSKITWIDSGIEFDRNINQQMPFPVNY